MTAKLLKNGFITSFFHYLYLQPQQAFLNEILPRYKLRLQIEHMCVHTLGLLVFDFQTR